MDEHQKSAPLDTAAGRPDADAILEASLDSMLLVDREATILDLNPTAEEAFGYRASEIVGQSLEVIVWEAADEDDFGTALEHIRASDNPAALNRRIQARGIRVNGIVFPIEVAISRANRVEPPLYLVSIRDITERVDAQETLESSQSTLANLMSNLPGMAYRSREPAHEKMSFVSEGCMDLTGYEADVLLEDPEITYNGLIHPDDVDETLSQIRKAAEGREAFQLVYRIRTATGEEKWVLDRGQGVYSVFSAENELVALEGFVFDITERKLAEEARASLLTLQRELDVASTIQQSMLPQVFPERPDLDIYAKMIPAKAVGGDFYDFFFLDDKRLGVVIGDVSGKGVPAALYMSITRALIKSTARTGISPDECLRRVNQLLREERLSHIFITLFYAIIDLSRGKVEFCNAGHNPPYHVSANAPPRPLDQPSGIVLGVTDQPEYFAGHLTLDPGDGLFLYTDGITEAMDSVRNQYGEDRLCACLQDNQGGAEQRIHAVLEDVRHYADGVLQFDDITALAVFMN